MALSQYLCGVRPEFDGLRVEPRLPAHIRQAEIVRVWKGVRYVIAVENLDPKGIVTLSADNPDVRTEGTLVRLLPGAKAAEVRLTARIGG